jgi:hypothetical protein
MYYGEFLSLCDAPVLETLCKDALTELPATANPALSTILLSLPSCARNAPTGGGGDLVGLRMNWDRYSTLLGTVWGKFAGPGSAALTACMADVRDRSEYVDHISVLMKKYFLPYEIWWHMPSLSEAFEKGFDHNAKPLCFFPILSFVSLNIHEDNLVEAKELSRLTWKFCDRLMGKFSTHLTALLDSYWSLYDELEKKTLGKEAMRRLEKQYSLKQAKDKALASGKKDPSLAQPEQHPGYESEGWAMSSIASLVRVRKRLLHLMTAVKTMGTFFIFDREYNVEFAIRDAFSYYFSTKLRKIVSQKGEISRPSLILKSIVVGCRVMQSLCNIVSFDLPQFIRSFLFDNFCDTSISPPGTVSLRSLLVTKSCCLLQLLLPTIHDLCCVFVCFIANDDSMQVLSGHVPVPVEGEKERIIWAIGRWFINFVDEASAQNSGLMWLPATSAFARSDSKQRPIDIYINREEIMSLCTFIGPQGVRCIDSMLIQVVADKVICVVIYLYLNK